MRVEENYLYHAIETFENKGIRILADEIPAALTGPEDVNFFVGRDIGLINKNYWVPGTKNVMVVNPDFYFETMLFNSPDSLKGFDLVIFNTRDIEVFQALSGLIDGKTCQLPLDISMKCPYFTEAAIALTIADMSCSSKITLVGVNVQDREKYLRKYKKHVRSRETQVFQELASLRKLQIT